MDRHSTSNATLRHTPNTAQSGRFQGQRRITPSSGTGLPVSDDGDSVAYDGDHAVLADTNSIDAAARDLDVVGAGTGLRDVIDRISQVAGTDAPVLLEGETGSGKEVVARLLHERSLRSDGPMIRVNCGAIPPHLIDSELFGHERGAFTGAIQTRHGWFERAHGGTLFLDEIAELPLDAQVRLLRVLQEGTLERLGGGKTIAVDVRVVAATHRDLRAMCREGTFRSDLWYRIGVFCVRIPPLRERMEDIAALAAHFADRAGRRLTNVPLVPSPAELAQLRRYDWPGNVRELAAVIERAAILGRGTRLELQRALGEPGLAASEGGGDPDESGSHRIPPGDEAPFPTLEEVVRRHIEQALRLSRGRIEGRGGAADRLGTNPFTLRGKMRKLRIDWASFRVPR